MDHVIFTRILDPRHILRKHLAETPLEDRLKLDGAFTILKAFHALAAIRLGFPQQSLD
jgi:hypothetical protein